MMGLEPKTILLVEDDPLLALTETHWLKKAGYNPIHVLSGEKAVGLVREKKFPIDLILMDINLGPGIDGTQAASEILKENDVPLLFLSSHTEKEVVEKTEKITSYGYVVKDSKEVVLLASIKMAFKLFSANKELIAKEAALVDSELKFQNAVENSSDGIFIHVNQIIEYVNPSLVRLSGFSSEEMLGKPFLNFVHPDDVPMVLDRYKRRSAGEAVESLYEVKLRYKNGETCNAEVNVAPINYKESPAVLVTVRDITERKRVEKELRESEERYKALLQSVTDYIYSVQLENGKTVSNAHSIGCVAITGYSPEDFQNDPYLWYKMVHDSDKKFVVEESERILAGKTAPVLEHRIVHKDGSIRWIRNNFVLQHNRGETLVGYDGLIEDITERKEAEIELRASEKKFKSLFEKSPIGYHSLNEQGVFVEVNQTWLDVLGYAREEIIGKWFGDFLSPHYIELFKRNFARLKSEGKIYSELMMKKKNGTLTYVAFEGRISHNSAGEFEHTHCVLYDLTERKHAERELQTSLSILEATLESTADGILVVDSNALVVKYNKKFAELWRIPLEILDSRDDNNLLGYVLKQVKFPAAFLERVKEIYSQPELISFDMVEFKDGRIYERYSQPQLIEGKTVGRVWSFSDITEQKRVEFELQEGEKKYKDLVEKILDGVYKSTHAGKFLEVNEAMVKMLGYESKEDLLAIDIKKQLYFQEEDRESAALQEKQEEMAVFRVKKKDGSEIWVEDHGRHVLDESGNVLYHEGIMRNVTERVKSERIQRTLYEISDTAYLAADITDLYKRIHKAISELVKVKNFYIAVYDETKDVLSFPYFVDEFDSQPEPKKLGRGLTEYVLRTQKALLVDTVKDIQLRNAGEVDLVGTPQAIWLGVPLVLAGKAIGVIVVQDYENEKAFGEEEMHLLTFVSEHIAQVIERKKNEEEIEKITAELRQSNQMKDKFFSIIAHDLKNPFHTMNAVLKLLLSEEESIPAEDMDKFLKGLLETSEKAHSLLENLLLWSQHQMGKMNYQPEKIELAEMIFSSIDFLRNAAYLKNINLLYEVKDSISVTADRNMIETVLRNLVSNAIKFTNDGGEIKIEARTGNGFVEVSVIDNGVGIPAKDLGKLFRIDQSFTTQGTKSETGTGLGLILCKEFVEKNNGHLTVESKIGEGTKISFTLPLS